MIKFFLFFIVFCFNVSCSSNYLMVKLYDGAGNEPVPDPTNYEILYFHQQEIANALAETVTNPVVWFGGGIPRPSRNVKILKPDINGIFWVPEEMSVSDFLVVLNKEKSLIACYNTQGNFYVRLPGYPRKNDLRGQFFYDVTCKEGKIEEDERRAYYVKLFNDINVSRLGYDKMDYVVSRKYKAVTDNIATGERYVAPLYIYGSNPVYLLPNKEKVDDDGELKIFFNMSRI